MEKENKIWYSVAVKESTKRDLMIFKIKSKARNVDSVIRKAIKLLKEKRNDRKS